MVNANPGLKRARANAVAQQDWHELEARRHRCFLIASWHYVYKVGIWVCAT